MAQKLTFLGGQKGSEREKGHADQLGPEIAPRPLAKSEPNRSFYGLGEPVHRDNKDTIRRSTKRRVSSMETNPWQHIDRLLQVSRLQPLCFGYWAVLFFLRLLFYCGLGFQGIEFVQFQLLHGLKENPTAPPRSKGRSTPPKTSQESGSNCWKLGSPTSRKVEA